jgi:hypothetical protein
MSDCLISESNLSRRRQKGRDIREKIKKNDFPNIKRCHKNNNEEEEYSNYIANYSKALPHHEITDMKAGEVEGDAYKKLLKAIRTGKTEDFKDIPLGGNTTLTNPLAGVAFDLEGIDSHFIDPGLVPPAPTIDSAEAAGEMAELYCMALCRDVHFNDFDTDTLIQRAVNDLSTNYTKFPVPKNNNTHPVTTKNIFRGFTKEDVKGPFVSQFLLKGSNDIDRMLPNGSIEYVQKENEGFIKYGSLRIDQRQWTIVREKDYLTTYQELLNSQNGMKPPRTETDSCGNNYDTELPRFIRNMRDLANYVHFDDVPQEFVNACLLLLHMEVPCINPQMTFDKGIPYGDEYENQMGFGTFGQPHFLTIVAEVTTRALKVCWFYKWFVHRRLRPEAFGGLIHRQKTASRPPPAPSPAYPIHNEILNSAVLDEINTKYNSYLLPQAFPEGAPTHPSYPAGHATIAGACVTILKAFFYGGFEIKNPVSANADGTALIDYTGPDKDELTVEGELNKLASNISLGRNMAGVHYRSDHTQSLKLGEAIAIGILEDQKNTYREQYCLKLRKFDGNVIEIGNNC